MARKWQSGIELQSLTTGVEFDAITGAPTIDTTTFRSGAASLNVAPSATTAFITQQFGANSNTNDWYVRFYLYITTAPASGTPRILVLRDGNQAQDEVAIRITSTRALQLFDAALGTLLGSNSAVLNTAQWYRVELGYTHANVTATAYLDGVSFATGAISGPTPNLDTLKLGAVTSTTCNLNFDDIAVNDATGASQTGLPGSEKIIHLVPNGAGESNGFTTQVGGSAGAANNFTRVDEVIPDDATSYNGSTTLNAEDLFDFTNSGIGASDTVNVVAVGARMANITSADATAALKLEIEKANAGTKSQSTSIIPNSTAWLTNASAAPKNYPLVTYQDPDAANWTQTTLDSLRAGYIQSVTNAQTIAVSTLWVSVAYTPAAGGPTTSTSTTSTSSSTSTTSTSSSTSTSTSTTSTSSSTSTSTTSTSSSTSTSTTSTSSSTSTSTTSTSSSTSTSTTSTSSSTSTSTTSTSSSTSTSTTSTSSSTSTSTTSTSSSTSTTSTSTSTTTSTSTSTTSSSTSTTVSLTTSTSTSTTSTSTSTSSTTSTSTTSTSSSTSTSTTSTSSSTSTSTTSTSTSRTTSTSTTSTSSSTSTSTSSTSTSRTTSTSTTSTSSSTTTSSSTSTTSTSSSTSITQSTTTSTSSSTTTSTSTSSSSSSSTSTTMTVAFPLKITKLSQQAVSLLQDQEMTIIVEKTGQYN